MKKVGLFLVAAAMVSGLVVAMDHSDDGARHGGRHGKFMGKMLERMDTDGDGAVSEAEFVEAHRERFARMDGNGDGQLERDEVRAHHKAMREQWRERRQEQEATRDAPQRDD